MSTTAKSETAGQKEAEPLFQGVQECLNLTRQTLEEQAEQWQRMGDQLRQGEYDAEAAMKDLQDGTQRAVSYCTSLVELGIRNVSALVGSFGSERESD